MDRIIHRTLSKLRSVEFDVSLASLTSYKVGGVAKAFSRPNSEDEVLEILRLIKEHNIPFFFLGNGSNVLISDSGYEGVIIKLGEKFEKISIQGTIVKAGAATNLFGLIKLTSQEELSGLETLSGIPGSVGGALFMNAGAYGKCISDVLIRLRAIDPKTLQIAWHDQASVEYEYRGAKIPLYHLWAEFLLEPSTKEEIEKEIQTVLSKRKKSQPLTKPSAGCVFKNPPDQSAGRIIDELGLKGLAIGGAEVSPIHASFIVTNGDATASDIYELINMVKKTVKIQRDIDLELEVQLKGNFGGHDYK